jgi:hypothetical protein
MRPYFRGATVRRRSELHGGVSSGRLLFCYIFVSARGTREDRMEGRISRGFQAPGGLLTRPKTSRCLAFRSLIVLPPFPAIYTAFINV